MTSAPSPRAVVRLGRAPVLIVIGDLRPIDECGLVPPLAPLLPVRSRVRHPPAAEFIFCVSIGLNRDNVKACCHGPYGTLTSCVRCH
jgi:hypothetical protein